MLAFTCHVFLLANNPFAVQAHNSNFTVSYCTGNMSQRGGAAGGPKVKRVMTQAINLIFEFLKNKERVQIWLFENVSMKMEGVIIGFDEYMNVVLDDAVEINTKSSSRKQIGRILLKGDCITLIQRADPTSGESL